MRLPSFIKSAIVVMSLLVPSIALGGSNNPHSGVGSLKPGYRDQTTVIFFANQTAEFAVVGDGDGDLDCYVFDNNGNTVAFDNSSFDGCSLQWHPIWTGYFVLKVVNSGNITDIYQFAWN
jgi:hypothetical protein